ncbi:MAG: rRNA maturation RNase YbeY [Ruminococcaceae bacterium]|nr:rRNA maturation RNase YbeY [Oscillospiraceae bacterium]
MKIKHSVFIENEQDIIKADVKLKKLIKDTVSAALEYEGFEGKAEVSVTLCDNEYIHGLNLEYRGIDRATDVLSFPLFDEEDHGITALGDIVLSLERAKEQAEEFGHSFERELAFLTAHSMLHLLGYDHETSEEDERDMFARQEAILEKMGITRD